LAINPRVSHGHERFLVDSLRVLSYYHCMRQTNTAKVKSIAPTPKRVELTETQEVILESLADLFHNGGDLGDVEDLVYTALAHRARLRSGFLDDKNEVEQAVQETRNWHFYRWTAELAKLHRRRPESVRRAVPKDVSERFRENVRAKLRHDFASFLQLAAPGDLHLMAAVLSSWISESSDSMAPDAQIWLARAFELELGGDSTYVKIPERYVGAVEELIEVLRRSEAE